MHADALVEPERAGPESVESHVHRVAAIERRGNARCRSARAIPRSSMVADDRDLVDPRLVR